MFIIIQFPLADARCFVHSKTYKLNRPMWPLVYPGRDFVRCSGLVERRIGGGIKDWIGEDLYCRANRAIRYPRLETRRLGGKDTSVKPYSIFRRFFSDGKAVARVEIAFWISAYNINENQLLSILESCLGLPVEVVSLIDSNVICDLQFAGSHLAKLYLYASTQTAYQKDSILQDWWISFCEPLIMVNYMEQEVSSIPKVAHAIESLNEFNIQLSHLWFIRKGRPVRV